jgi:hypothetical protein
LKELQPGKAVGPDGMPNELLKYGGDIMLEHFPKTFTVILEEMHLLLKLFNLSALIFIFNSMFSWSPRELVGPSAKGNIAPLL